MYSNLRFKLDSASPVDPGDHPILIKNLNHNSGANDGPATGGPNPAELMAGSRSGVGRLQKAGLGSSVHDTVANSRPVSKSMTTGGNSPPTSGGYDSSGINPSAGRPRVPGGIKLPGNMLPQKPVSKTPASKAVSSTSPVTRNPKLNARAPRGRKGFLR